jgi:entericidin B
MKNLKLASIFMLLMFMLSACNTMEGAGEDIQSAGEELEDAANKSR